MAIPVLLSFSNPGNRACTNKGILQALVLKLITISFKHVFQDLENPLTLHRILHMATKNRFQKRRLLL